MGVKVGVCGFPMWVRDIIAPQNSSSGREWGLWLGWGVAWRSPPIRIGRLGWSSLKVLLSSAEYPGIRIVPVECGAVACIWRLLGLWIQISVVGKLSRGMVGVLWIYGWVL